MTDKRKPPVDLIFDAIEAGAPRFQGDMPSFVRDTREYWSIYSEKYQRPLTAEGTAAFAIQALEKVIPMIGTINTHEGVGELVAILTMLHVRLLNVEEEAE